MQLDLFDRLPQRVPGAGAEPVRRHLLGNAWVDYAPEWLAHPGRVLELVMHCASWEQHRRPMYDRIVEVPRLMAGDPRRDEAAPYRDGEVVGRPRFGNAALAPKDAAFAPKDAVCPPASTPRRDQAELSALLDDLSARLSERYGRRLDGISLALYRGGRDSVAWHGDKLGELRRDTVVAIVSVGARRRFLLRPGPRLRTENAACATMPPLRFDFGWGDLLVMGGSCQETWEHCVPKMARAGLRAAIMFRERARPRKLRVPA